MYFKEKGERALQNQLERCCFHPFHLARATSIVSALAQEILKNSSMALIHVLRDNAPAVQVYTKVGLKPYKQYFLMRAKRRN